ncbi:MAG: glycosyltransferase family 1 protein [Rubritepida sp.]|nr:glycosyltransferase family 1 protein [Rubritepida sp.]
MRILIVSDAWMPQVNGVVRTLATVRDELFAMGHTVEVVGPDRFLTMPAPSEPDVRLALLPGRRLRRIVDAFAPDAIHIATEGPLGLAARRLCLRRGWPFTTAFHTRFPEYLKARLGVPERMTWALMRRFHKPSAAVMTATASLRDELAARGFANVAAWTRGVDLGLFRPRARGALNLPRPLFLYVGRVAVEKNIEAFLALDLPGSKVVVGDGPVRAALESRFAEAHFLGAKFGEDLAAAYAEADVFVFPSLTDTFGLVIVEALACGTPVAAFPVTGPKDVIGAAPVGALDADLRAAALAALGLDREACRRFAEGFSWRRSAEILLERLAPIERGGRATS